MTSAATGGTLFTNATIATMHPARPAAGALLVRDGRVAALGDAAALRRDAPDASTVDLGGRFLCPGFVDAHNHFSLTALEPISVDLRPPAVASIADLQERLRAAHARAAHGRWLRGHGYDDEALGRHPTRADLDAVAPDRPLLLVHWSVHRAVAGSAALRDAGIDPESADPPAGRRVRDAAGDLTGLLYERAADPLQAASLAAYAEEHAAALPRLFQDNAARMHAAGITALGDAYVHPALLDAYRRWSAAAAVPPLRVRPFCGSAEGLFAPPTACLDRPQGEGDGAVLLGGGVKIFVDGGGNTTATSLASGRPPRILFYRQEELDALVERAHAAALPVAIHAAGDIAVTMALDAIERARRAHPAGEPRFRIEHAIALKAPDIPRLRSLEVAVVTQPEAVCRAGARLATAALAEGVRVAPFRDLLDAGVTLAFSSDSPCYALAPLWQIWCATTRATIDGPPLADGQAVTVEEALAAYTRAGAAALFDPDGGRLVPGARADFLVLSRDPRRPPPARWSEVQVERVYVGGAPVEPSADPAPPGRLVPLP